MKIDRIQVTVLEVPGNTALFDLGEETVGPRRRWRSIPQGRAGNEIHLLRVGTDAGIEGICTVGDARYTTLQTQELAQLRILALGADPFDRERLHEKLTAATRTMFVRPGWFGAFDNCLWDIAGQVAGLPVWALLGRSRDSVPAYYNIGGAGKEAAVADGLQAVERGFPALKDHFSGSARENLAWCQALREAVGSEIDLFHDAVGAAYTYEDALMVGRGLHELDYGWLEEPLEDRDQAGLQRLCAALDIPVLALESLMHDQMLSARWLISGVTDLVRANARHGVTQTVKLAHLAQLHGTRIELNGPGGLFGLVHAHLACAIPNTTYYEYFPGGSRDEAGKHIGLTNPPLPQNGRISPPDAPGWGAEWDWARVARHTVATL